VINAQSVTVIKPRQNLAFQFVEFMKFTIHQLQNVNAEQDTISFKENVMFAKQIMFMRHQFKIVFLFVESTKHIHFYKKNVYARTDYT